nr:DUF1963 domain-containing protein [Bradyrhizobium iriomotense]
MRSIRGRPQPLREEQVSVILKRRVPISVEQPALSWLGGLPMMPRSVKWPCDSAGSPLHFLAQIHCDDLPADLWNGLGPRKGWLLLFANVLKLEDEAKGKTVQVLHIDALGPETEPPAQTPTVRHVMRDYIDWSSPRIRPGVPKLWRKWPLELVAQRYRLSETDWRGDGSPLVSGANLYGAPESDQSLHASGSLDLDRPLTWRGAYYVVEGLLRDLDPDDYAQRFRGLGALNGPPEPDQNWFNAEFDRRAGLRKEFADREIGYGPRIEAARAALNAEIKAERRTGWMPRCFIALDAEAVRFKGFLADYEQKLVEAGATEGGDHLSGLEGNLRYYKEQLQQLEENRRYLTELFEPYSGGDGEEALNVEIELSANAHLAWVEQQGKALKHWRDRILAQDLEAVLPGSEWAELTAALMESRSAYWLKTYDTRVLEKVERSLNFKPHLEMAIREDMLDLYVRGDKALSQLPAHIVDDLQQRLRHVELGRPHRMGGHPNPVQHENQADDSPLLFQLASDQALGWGWGDLGALYVTIEERDLARHRFDKIHAWIEGG